MGPMAILWAIALLTCQIWAVAGQSYPSCSVGCVSSAVPSTCNSTDNVCICQQVDQASLLSCLASNCGCTDQQTAAATFDSTCASNGIQLALNVACAATSSSITSSSGSGGPSLSSTAQSASSIFASSTAVTSSAYSAPAPASTAITTSVQGSTLTIVSSTSEVLSTSTAVVIFMSSDSTVVTFLTSTHWYTPTPLATSSAISSSAPSTTSSPIATVVAVSQGSLISHGLATGAKAGIGAGVGAVVIAATIFSLWIFWLCRRKRRKTSSITDSNHDNPSTVPGVPVGAPMQERRLAELKILQELPSETASRKPTLSWANTSITVSSEYHSPASEEDGFRHSVSAESGQHSPPIDPTAYQRPNLGNDGYRENTQELQGGITTPDRPAAPAPANFQPLYLHKVQSRPIVPPGKWPPNSYGGFS